MRTLIIALSLISLNSFAITKETKREILNQVIERIEDESQKECLKTKFKQLNSGIIGRLEYMKTFFCDDQAIEINYIQTETLNSDVKTRTVDNIKEITIKF